MEKDRLHSRLPPWLDSLGPAPDLPVMTDDSFVLKALGFGWCLLQTDLDVG